MKVHNLLVTGSHTSSGEDIKFISSSVATINNAQNDRLNSIESITGSIVSKTGSFATTGSNLFKGTQTLSGSIIPAVDNAYDLGSVTHQFRDLYLSSASLYIDGTKVLSSTTQELQITTDAGQSFKILEAGSDTITLQSNDGNITLATSGGGDVIMDPTNGIIALKGTTTIYAGNRILSSDGNNIHFGNGVVISGSLLATGTNLISGSSQILNGSGIISSSTQLPSGIVSSSSQVTGYGFSTTGSNTFLGSQIVTGSLFISENLIVAGSSSIQHISSSVVNIADNIITVNALNPSVRFGGLAVIDSGSNPQVSGSMLFDSINNQWLFVHQNQGTVTSSVLLMGPETYNDLGNETYITANRLVKSTGIEHLTDSNISDNGTTVTILSNAVVNGTFSATGTTLVSGSAQITYGSISSIPSGIVSGSAQVDVMSTTNIARLATTGSNIFTSNQVVTGSISSTGNIKSEGVLQWNNGIGALSYGGGSVTMETNTTAPILLRTNGTTAITISTGQTVTFANDILTGIDKGIKFDSSGASGHPEISVDSGVNLNFKNSAGLTNLRLKNNGELIVSGSINIANGSATNTLNINQPGSSTTEFHLGHFSNGTYISNNYYYSGGHLYTDNTLGSSTILLDTNGIYLRASGPNAVPGNHMFISGSGQIGIGRIDQTKRLDIYDANTLGTDDIVRAFQNLAYNHAFYRSQRNGGANMLIGATRDNVDGNIPANVSILWNVSNHDIAIGANNTEDVRILASSGNVGINDTNPSKKLTVNFGSTQLGGITVYGSARQETIFKSTGEHCFLYIDSAHSSTYLPVLHLQRSSSTFGTIGLQRASNSDPVGAYEESEMIVGSTASVSLSLQTNGARRVKIASGGSVTVYNNLSVNGNLTARNFSRNIKSWAPAGGTGSGTSTTYNWADELASVSGNFDSGGYYRGFIRSGNGAHYYGYHFDILVGSIGYGGNSLQFKVQNVVGANSPWAGGCGFPPFGTVDTTGFVHVNNPCGEYLELYITKLGG
jgi:hypothetical protein